MIVAGIDVSLVSTGIAINTASGAPFLLRTIQSKPPKVSNVYTQRARIREIADRVLDCARGADLVVIEGPAYAAKGGHAHDRSGCWWAIVDALIADCIPVAEVPPTVRITYATGKGNSSKDAVLAETVRRYPAWPVSNNDEADSLVLCALGLDHLGRPLVTLPQTHRRALESVPHWPAMPQGFFL